MDAVPTTNGWWPAGNTRSFALLRMTCLRRMFKGLSDCRSRSAATAFEGRLGGDSIGETLELDALLVQRANQIDQVFDAATKSLQFPDNKGIALA